MFDGLKRIIYQSGEEIFREGDSGFCAYLIESGTVEVTILNDMKNLNLETLGAGELFGEIALIDNKPRTATVTTLEKTRVVKINSDLFQAKLAKADPLIEHLLLLILRRFRKNYQRQTGTSRSMPEYVNTDFDQAFSDTQENLIEHFRIASDINEALEQEQFQLYYQPITSIKDKSLAGFEALIRWHHPQKGLMAPMEFLDIAENTDQILPIGIWTLDRACRDLDALSRANSHRSSSSQPSELFISVNLSARQLTKAADTNDFLNILQKAGVDPSRIKLEVTETALIEEPEITQQILSDLRESGFHVSLDDFGTGYSSLSYLQKFPVDDIKIDRSFVSRMFSDNGSMQIVKASIDLADAMDLEVIAEGVETKEELELLDNMHCAYAQGYYFSKPLPLAEAIEYAALHH